jgi:RimJ/RimL family protein N-acetyltransferase
MPSSPPVDAGTEITIRPLRAEDREAFGDAFDRMSAASRYQRFLGAMPRLSESQLTYLTDVDQRDHVALAAANDAGIVGVARFIRLDDTKAELAMAVVDDWRGRGLGRTLLAALVDEARALGVTRFEATVLADNVPMLRLLRGLGEIRSSPVGAALHVTVDLV